MYGYKSFSAEDAKGKLKVFLDDLEAEIKRDYAEKNLFECDNDELEEEALSMARGIRAFRDARDLIEAFMDSYCVMADDVKYMKASMREILKTLEEKK